MRLLFFLSLIVLSSYQIQAQNYWESINKAETFITQKSYANACEMYENIFKVYKNVSYREYNNAFFCYLELKKYNSAANLIDDLILHGYTLKNFNGENFTSFSQTKIWNNFKNNSYNKYRKMYLEKLDLEYREELYRIIQKDQRASIHSDIIFRDSIYYTQTVQILNLFKQKGFPKTYIQKDTLVPKLTAVFRHYFGLMHRHQRMQDPKGFYASMNFEKHNLEIILDEAFKKHLFPPHIFINTYNYSEPGNKFGAIIIKVYLEEEKLEYYQLSDTQINKANAIREKYYLSPLTKPLLNYMIEQEQNYMPFKKIKKAFLTCDTCINGSDYASLFTSIINQNITPKRFELYSIPSINGYILMDDKKYFYPSE